VENSSQVATTNKPTPNVLQAGCPSCRPTNSVKALKGIGLVGILLSIIDTQRLSIIDYSAEAHEETL